MAKDPALGFNATLGIGIEDDEGTPVAAALWFDFSEEDCKSDTTLHESPGVGACVSGVMSREDQAAPAVPVKEDNKIAFTCEPRFAHLPSLLGLALGGAVGGNNYEVGNTPRSFTVEVNKCAELESGKSVEQYAGCKVTKLGISSQANKPLTIKVEGVARTYDVISGTTPDWSAWAAKPPMMHHGLTIVAGPTEIPATQIYEINCDIESGVEEDHFANSLTRICAPAGKLKVTGKVTVPWNDDTAPIQTKIKNGTRFDLQVRWAGAAAETFDLLLSCKALGDVPGTKDSKGKKLELKFQGYMSGTTHAIKAVLGS